MKFSLKKAFIVMPFIFLSCGDDPVELSALSSKKEPIVNSEEKEPITPTVEPEPEPIIEKTEEPITSIVEPEPEIDVNSLYMELRSSNKIDISLGDTGELDVAITDGSKDYYFEDGLMAFSSSEKILEIDSIVKIDEQYQVKLKTVSAGESIVTLFFLENPTVEKSVLVRVKPQTLESQLLEKCPNLKNSTEYKALSDINSGDASASKDSAVSINSRVPIADDYEKSRVSILYKMIDSSYSEFAPKTVFFRDNSNRLIATIGYSKNLVFTPFYIIYTDINGNEICSDMQIFPTYEDLESGGDSVEIEETLPTLGDIKPEE